MLRSKRIILAAATAVVSTSSLWQFKAQGATFTWDGGGASDSFTVPQNWSTDVAPSFAAAAGTVADDLLFAGTTRLTPINNTTNANQTANQIIFGPTAGSF